MVLRRIREALDDGGRMQRVIREQRANRSPGRSTGGPGTNCLILGGGGREYAIAWRLARSDSVASIDVIPGNAGVGLFARTLDFPVNDAARMQQHLAAAHIDLA
ncbi:MAG TPA: phosphoribosylamine--glycine ligase N-terminal domain-containing protein, partial [Candidatus Limnocylindria bacterium]